MLEKNLFIYFAKVSKGTFLQFFFTSPTKPLNLDRILNRVNTFATPPHETPQLFCSSKIAFPPTTPCLPPGPPPSAITHATPPSRAASQRQPSPPKTFSPPLPPSFIHGRKKRGREMLLSSVGIQQLIGAQIFLLWKYWGNFWRCCRLHRTLLSV